MSTGPAYLCMDLGGTIIKAGVVRDARVISSRQVESRATEGLAPQLDRIKHLLQELATEAGVTVEQCGGLGIAFPTLIDARRGKVMAPMDDKYRDVMGVDLNAWAQRSLGMEAKLENDAHAALLGEWRFGAGRGCDDLVMITLGTGIGSSVIIGGRPLRGRHSQAGVLGGHLIINPGPEGLPCACGGRGCIETEAASAAARRIAKQDPGFSGSALAREKAVDFESIFRLAAAGDPLAVRVRDRCLHYWGGAIVSLIHCFDPSRVIIGGGVMQSARTILGFLRGYVNERAWTPWGTVELVAAELGNNAALLGLSTLFDERAVEFV